MPRWFLLTGLALILTTHSSPAQRRACPQVPGQSLALVSAAPALAAQNFAPPEPVKPADEQLKEIGKKLGKLVDKIADLKRAGIRDPFLADAEIYAKAGEWISRHGEFYDKNTIDWTLEALDRGLLRAAQMSRGESPWLEIPLERPDTPRTAIRAYRSRVDGSLQPYAVTLPVDYGTNPKERYRLDVVLHGRNSKLTEVSFLHQFNGSRAVPKGQKFVQIDIYGRGNNAYRWAGETDVLDAVEHFIAVERGMRRELLDGAKVVLRGFSMGGAGTWHLGLHRPDKWCVIGPGAGFTATHGYTVKVADKLPEYQEACLKIYDAVEYAENAFHVPIVAYSGEKDRQKQAADNIEDRLKQLKLPLPHAMKHLIAPGLEHSFPAKWQEEAEKEYAKYTKDGRPDEVKRVRFVTHTLKYNRCEWVEILGLDRHYDRTVVDAVRTDEGYKITTANVRGLHLTLPLGEARPKLEIDIDGKKLEARPFRPPNVPAGADEAHLYLEKRDGSWKAVFPQKIITDRLRRVQKVPGMQGPIDDAFMDAFLCVRGTGKPWNAAVQAQADAALKQFQETWDKHMRGLLLVKDDTAVTGEDIETRSLILFGDPGSNSVLAQALDGLPLQWTEKTVRLGNLSGAAANHLPVLIHPSPLNFNRYIVLNSGHTFGAADFRDTNAMLYPRLGDYALLKLAPTDKDPLKTEVVGAGLFDEFWRAKK
jgi:dienelactone hydrolase